jgi:phage terminase large subunit-like protein
MSSVIMCPLPDDEPWPTLGPLVCDWIEEHLCYGPGDLLGRPVLLNEEEQAWLYRMYEIEPPMLTTRRGKVVSRSRNPRAGRRRFQRCALSLRKGSAKTEKAAWITAVELHPEAPARCDGYENDNPEYPIWRAVSDPYIPMIAYTEEQSEELAYGALRRILQEVPIGNDFDIGLERILRLDGRGKAEAVSATPNARDGARTTFQHADETHRFTLDGLKRAWTVMLANLAKRPLADPWALETTTAPEPGAGSVAENTMEYANAVIEGKAQNTRLFFYHRQASESHDLMTRDGLKAAIVEASGPHIAKWSDIDRIAATFEEPDADRAYLERVWLNRLVQSSGRAFDIKQWQAAAAPATVVPEGAPIVLGFDGSRRDDHTSIVATHIDTGHQWPLGIWVPPQILPHHTDDQAKAMHQAFASEVSAAVADAMSRWHVTRFYCDPPLWEETIAGWSAKYGEKVVAEWWTNRRKPMAYAIRSFVGAITTGALTHNGDPTLTEHIANARQSHTNLVDDEGRPLWVLRKERPDSPKKIDGAMAAVLSWEARNDALAAGEAVPEEYLLYVG